MHLLMFSNLPNLLLPEINLFVRRAGFLSKAHNFHHFPPDAKYEMAEC